MEETFTLRIQSFGDSEATIGDRSSVELRISKNDHPHGVLEIVETSVTIGNEITSTC